MSSGTREFGFCDLHEELTDEVTYRYKGCWGCQYFEFGQTFPQCKLQSKGYMIVDEFSCGGFNTNSFNKLFGLINKGKTNAEDLKHAEEFAQNLKQNR